MITVRTTSGEPRSTAALFASILQGAYRDLLEEGVPEDMAALVRQVATEASRASRDRPLAIVVEGDPGSRALASALLEESDLQVVECASAEAAFAVLQGEADKTAFLFADEDLAGPGNGRELVASVRKRWPTIHVVITTDLDAPSLPPDIVHLVKPWRGLDLLIQAEQALAAFEPSRGNAESERSPVRER